MSNQLKTRNGIPFDFVDGLRIKGVDVTNWDKVFIDQGASYVGFQPVGNLAASNVQAAIAELESEKQSKSEPITTAINLRPGANQGVVWDIDAFGGGGDSASITLETAGGEATKMRFKMTNDADDNFEFTAKTPDGLTVFNNAMTLNGNTILNSANLENYTAPPITDYTALRAYVGSATQIRITSTGIAGFFYYDSGDATSPDNGGTVIVSSNGRRWKRVFEGAVNVFWFMTPGQIADVSSFTFGTPVSSAVRSADSFASLKGCDLYFPAGGYSIADRGAPLTPSVTWRGESHWYNHFSVGFPSFQPPNRGTVIDSGTGNIATLSGNLTALEILNITFRGSGLGAHMDVSSGTRMFRVYGCSFYGKENAVKVSGAVAYILRFERLFTALQTSHSVFFDWGTGSFNDIGVKDCWIFRPAGNGIYATGSTGGCTEFNVLDNNVTDGSGDNTAIAVAGVQGCRIVGNDVEGWGAIYTDSLNLTGKTGYNANARAIQISGGTFIVEGNVTYGGGASFSPIRVLTATKVRIGPNRILKDISTQTYALSIDSASSEVIIEPQQHDYPSSSLIAAGALNIINNISGSPTSNATHTFTGSINANGPINLNYGILLPATIPQVASATTIALPDSPIVELTGTVSVTFIAGMSRRIITLIFTDVLTLVDSPVGTGNLRLNGDFVTTPASTITLMATGTGGSWREISRSSNG